MAIRRYQYQRFCSRKGSEREVAMTSAYMLIKFFGFQCAGPAPRTALSQGQQGD
jgi:hypothetical protein